MNLYMIYMNPGINPGMNLGERALHELLPEQIGVHSVSLRYSGKFSGYNGNVRFRNNHFQIGLGRQWKDVAEEIQMGLVQLLILKVLKKKKKTHYIDMYNSFMKKVHIGIPKTAGDAELEGSFFRVSEKYFGGMVEKPNLGWCDSVSKLGSYDFGRDTVSISRVLSGKTGLLDYVMYHELLHKKHKFDSGNLRSRYHTSNFREDERAFENSDEIEKELGKLVGRARIRNWFFRRH